MLKIKVNIDKETYQKLILDMISFKIIKKDNTPNKNKFMNLLFINYYEEYNEEINQLINQINDASKKYKIKNNDFINDIVFNILTKTNQSLTTYYSESLTFYFSKENEFIFNTINANLSASTYFRRLIECYLKLPQYKREQIIFKQNYLIINNAIKNHQTIKIKLDNNEILINPYKIGPSKEELFSYLLGVNNNYPLSIHLSKIKAIVTLKDTFTLTKEIKHHLDLILNLGIQFPFKNICKAEIILSNQGKKKFKAKYLNRPTPVKIEDNHYYFECSFEQLFTYFASFGENMKIISPDYLAKSIYKLYKGYIDEYENKSY